MPPLLEVVGLSLVVDSSSEVAWPLFKEVARSSDKAAAADPLSKEAITGYLIKEGSVKLSVEATVRSSVKEADVEPSS